MPAPPTAKRRWGRVLVIVLVLAAGLFGAVRNRVPEPTHQGRTAAEWLAELGNSPGGYDLEDVRRAVAAIGPAATNRLLRDLKRTPSLFAPPLEWLGGRLDSPRLRELALRRETARDRAALGLEWCGADPATLVPDLLVALGRYAEPERARRINLLLVKAGPAAVEPALYWALQAEPERAVIALEAVGHLLAPHQGPVPARISLILPLRQLLARTNPSLRAEALQVTMRAGPAVTGLADDVVSAGRRPPMTREVEFQAARCLGRIAADPAVAVPALAAWAGHPDEAVRREALLALATFGPEAAPALPAVVTALAHPAPSLRLPAMNVLRRIGAAAGPAAEPLLAQLADPDPMLRSGAARALGRIGAPPARAVPALAAALADPAPDVRRHAAEALGWFGPDAAPAVPELTRLLRDGEIPVRLAAIEALGLIGPAARAAVPALHAARNNDQSGVGRPVLEALARIEGAAPPAVGGWDATEGGGR